MEGEAENPLSRIPPFAATAGPPASGCCNVAKYCLPGSRRRMPNCSGRITAFSGNIVSAIRGVRQLRYNRAFYGPGIFPTKRGVIRRVRLVIRPGAGEEPSGSSTRPIPPPVATGHPARCRRNMCRTPRPVSRPCTKHPGPTPAASLPGRSQRALRA